ncbi:Sst2-like protein [Viridothelium virens]|uniref:Sst2-like protein n=1 Tax=Viridothelium virens TaxID=1048519 RepID=A0A6A6GSF8_VIRVR|nr:Sst2-like protein [Viridothelium virens]
MHQTSSRLLRMTEDERPFTRDFKDLFSTLMVSLPLTTHRVRFQRVEHTFTAEEAITNLGSLKFSQSNRMPDPKDPSRIVTTTTTTTFSMAREMARSVCTRFAEARFCEAVDQKSDFGSKSSVWQLTPKGMHVLSRFCQRNGINQRHINDVLASPRNTMSLVILERDVETDKLVRDRATVEVLFRRFAGQDGPNIKSNVSVSDSDSVNEYQTGTVGVKVAEKRRVGARTYEDTFTGKAAVDWLMDCATVVDRRETYEICIWFIDHGFIIPINNPATETPASQASSVNGQYAGGAKFQPSKTAYYEFTVKGRKTAGWIPSPPSSISDDPAARIQPGQSRDSNGNRMALIIRDPALRLLFREFLRDTHCEENLSFHLEVSEFLRQNDAAQASVANANQGNAKLEIIRETLASAYSLYNAFLAPGSPCELNIDHSLRNALASRMTRAVGDDKSMVASLKEVANLFQRAQNSVFKLMASDSVPKFVRDPKYATMLKERNFDHVLSSTLANTSIS